MKIRLIRRRMRKRGGGREGGGGRRRRKRKKEEEEEEKKTKKAKKKKGCPSSLKMYINQKQSVRTNRMQSVPLTRVKFTV